MDESQREVLLGNLLHEDGPTTVSEASDRIPQEHFHRNKLKLKEP